MAVSETQLARWAQGPGKTEQDNCDGTVRAVTEALRQRFATRVRVFAQGSYRNRTNVRAESDVDVAVLDTTLQFSAFPGVPPHIEARVRQSLGPADMSYGQFKSAVEECLVLRFGRARVQRKNKCILVRETATRVDADVVPAFKHVRYGPEGMVVAEGIEFEADDRTRHSSFPEQHYVNGEAKHDRTARKYKRLVRILKNARNELVDGHQITAALAPSFKIECLAYNVPDGQMYGATYTAALRSTLEWLYADLQQGEPAQRYVEVNGLKWLFGAYTVPQALRFIEHVWRLVGLA